jgi:hypothetical protein
MAVFGACGDDGGGDGDGGGVDGGNGNGDGGAGGNGDGGAGNAEGCKLVDLVFAVDGSGSMTEELIAMSSDVFPAFATSLRQVGGGLDDYRVGVIDACPDPANFHTRGASTGECNFQSGEVWMTSESTALNDEFACVGDIFQGDVNCSGNNDDEQPISAAVASLSPPFIDGANAGFLREDALLVVVAITDEDEQPTPDRSAREVFDSLVAIKGDVQRMVFLGIGGASNCTGFYGTANQANKLIDVTNMFIAERRGVFWDLCIGQLEDGLTEAMEVIAQACDELPPIGRVPR